MIKVAELMGGTNVEERMKDILEFEKKLAAVSIEGFHYKIVFNVM